MRRNIKSDSRRGMAQNSGSGKHAEKHGASKHSDSRREERPARDSGYGRREERPSRDGSSYGRHEERPARDGSYARREERPARDGGYGRREERPARDGSGYGRREERPTRDSGGYGRREERLTRESSYSRKDERPSRPSTFGNRDDRSSRGGGFGKRDVDKKERRQINDRNKIVAKGSYGSLRNNKKVTPIKEEKSAADSEYIRINKYLADAGISSRRKADEFVINGAVKVNGKTVKELGSKVHVSDLVTVNGDPVSIEQHTIYIVLNKPKNYITTTSDDMGRKTVMDLVSKRARIYPVGRLDRNTTGVLLMTNDGELAHRLTHPSYNINRVYYVRLDRPLKAEDAEKIVKGVELDENDVTAPCELFIDKGDPAKISMVLTEGKNREIRRIFEHVGYEVKQLDRKEFAGINVSGILRGDYRHLDRKEVTQLKSLVGII